MSAVLQDFHTWAPDQGKELLKVCAGEKVGPQHTSALGARLIWVLAWLYVEALEEILTSAASTEKSIKESRAEPSFPI